MSENEERKFRTMHLKAGEEVRVVIPGVEEVQIHLEGKAINRGNRQTIRVEAPHGSSIEVVKV